MGAAGRGARRADDDGNGSPPAGPEAVREPAVDGKGLVSMFRRSISAVLCMVLMLQLLVSCAEERPSSVPGDAAIEEELSRSSEVAELIAIRDELGARAVERGVTPDEIRDTAGDADRANALLGLSPDEARARFERIHALVGALFARYPALADMAAGEEGRCAACDAEGVALAWEHYARVLPEMLGRNAELSQQAPARPPLICKMTQFIIGISLCALKSGGSAVFYFICSYGVFCGSCDGGIADLICP
jgi:hypothetical protein